VLFAFTGSNAEPELRAELIQIAEKVAPAVKALSVPVSEVGVYSYFDVSSTQASLLLVDVRLGPSRMKKYRYVGFMPYYMVCTIWELNRVHCRFAGPVSAEAVVSFVDQYRNGQLIPYTKSEAVAPEDNAGWL
jgi:hypothetical protein